MPTMMSADLIRVPHGPPPEPLELLQFVVRVDPFLDHDQTDRRLLETGDAHPEERPEFTKLLDLVDLDAIGKWLGPTKLLGA